MIDVFKVVKYGHFNNMFAYSEKAVKWAETRKCYMQIARDYYLEQMRLREKTV